MLAASLDITDDGCDRKRSGLMARDTEIHRNKIHKCKIHNIQDAYIQDTQIHGTQTQFALLQVYKDTRYAGARYPDPRSHGRARGNFEQDVSVFPR